MLVLYIAKIKLVFSAENSKQKTELFVFGKRIKLDRKKNKKSSKGEKVEEKQKGAEKDISAVKKLLMPLADAAGMAKKKLVISKLNLQLAVATDDAAKTAITFGVLSAAAGMLMGFIKFNFNVKSDRVNIYPDFSRETYLFSFDATLYIRILDVIIIAIAVFGGHLKRRVQEKKLNKKQQNNSENK